LSSSVINLAIHTQKRVYPLFALVSKAIGEDCVDNNRNPEAVACRGGRTGRRPRASKA